MAVATLPSVSEHDIHHSARKRLFDILFSVTVLVFAFPLYLCIALLIKITSEGPIFYAHRRIGRGGRPFFCYKFRTMYPDAEDRLAALLQQDAAFAAEWLAKYKVRDDPRITPFGRLLRLTSLDELPQFWNVLAGDLSVVGPRPIVPEEAKRFFGRKAALIWRVRPGITGLWQISGRSAIDDYNERIRLDEGYVQHWSFLGDLKIVFLTLPALLTSRGAY